MVARLATGNFIIPLRRSRVGLFSECFAAFCYSKLVALEVFIDESGYTGERHLDPDQPVFVLSSNNLTDEMTFELLARHFTGVQAGELKHSRLAKRANGQKRILDLSAASHRWAARMGFRWPRCSTLTRSSSS